MNEKFKEDLRLKYLKTFRDLLRLYFSDDEFLKSKDTEIFHNYSSKMEEASEKVCQELTDKVMNELDRSGLLNVLEESDFQLESQEMKKLESKIDNAAYGVLKRYYGEILEREQTSDRL